MTLAPNGFLLEVPELTPLWQNATAADRAACAPNSQLARALLADSALAARSIDWQSPSIPDFMRNPGVRYSPWPVFVSRDVIGSCFEKIVARLPAMFHRAMRALFGRDGAAFETYLGLPRVIYDILLQAPVNLHELVCRYDVVVEAHGAKVLELNCSSSAGGWQTDWLLPQIHGALESCHELTVHGCRHRRIFDELARHIADSIRRRKPSAARGNVAFFSFVEGASNRESLQRSLQTVWERVRPPEWPQGQVVLFDSMQALSFGPQHEVSISGVVVDAVLLTFPHLVEVPPPVLDRLNRAYFARAIVFPDSPFHTLLRTKLLFAVAHEARQRGLLAERDAALVDRYLPWTAIATEQLVRWRSTVTPLSEALINGREGFVLKKADSFGGRHVHIGRFMSENDWRQAILTCCAEGGWVAQAYCAPGRLDLSDGADDVTEHDLVWGVFGFGDRYGGAFIRGVPTQSTRGIVNAANGATEFVVFEEEA